jgi:oxaloacetate decarboxylase (Na+ extruding) subunit alpha
MREIRLIDTTIRDGNQSLWATRMTTAEALPPLEKMDEAGFLHLDVHSALHVEVCVRFLHEDPFERVRLMASRVKRTPLRMGFRSGNITGFSTRLPDDFVELWVRTWRACGIQVFWCHDGLIDVDNIGRNIAIVKRHGGFGVAPLTFTESPVHTDEMYARKAREVIERYGADTIMIKDSAGLLTVDRTRTLVPAILSAAGDVPVEIHSHCLTGLGPLVCLDAVKLGVDRVHTAIEPLADGPSHPSAAQMVRNLRTMGYTVNVDERRIGEVSEYLTAVAKRTRRPLGAPAQYDAFHYRHQVPGGMLTNFHAQLRQAGMIDKLDAVLEEIGRVRVELGWVLMVTPFSQVVGVQALLNVTTGERYKVVPDEVKRYALGHYGAPPEPIDPDVLDKIIANGSRAIPEEPPQPQPVVARLRAAHPGASDEELILRYLFEPGLVDALGPALPADGAPDLSIRHPIVYLLEELKRRPPVRRLRITKGDASVELVR